MAVDAACIPLPSDVIMSFAGYLASTGRFSLVLVAMAGAVGCNIGFTLAYAVDARGGRPLVERWGHYLLLNQGDLDRADRFFQRFGGPGVMVARLLPVVRTFVALPAGVAGMPMLHHVSRVVALALRPSLCRLQAGRALGERSRLRAAMHRFDLAIVGLLVFGLAWFVWRHVYHSRNGKRGHGIDHHSHTGVQKAVR